MFSKKLALQTAGATGAEPAQKPRGGMAVAGAALFLAAAAALLLAARGNPYDGTPGARAHIAFSPTVSTTTDTGRTPALASSGGLVVAPIAGLTAPGPPATRSWSRFRWSRSTIPTTTRAPTP